MWRALIPDRFLLTLIGTVALATALPARDLSLAAIGAVSLGAIFTLFFLHGARLPRRAVVDGLRGWRLQLAILGFGFVAMPLLGLAISTMFAGVLGTGLALGLLYLAVLPTTVQSSIAYSALAEGNVAAAVIASAASNLIGVVLTPLLLALLASASGAGFGLEAVGRIALLLLLPFALGQLVQPRIGTAIERRKTLAGMLDKVTIVLAVYVAFSEAANAGVWEALSADMIALTVAAVGAMLALAFAGAWLLGGRLGLAHADRITLLFAGAHKSIATGAPMARLLFVGPQAGLVLVPLLLYHQLQLMVSAVIASRLNRPS